MPTYKTPDVYVEEVSNLPPSVSEVSTAIPAFIGYTEKSTALSGTPQVARISTFLEYQNLFGGPEKTAFHAIIKEDNTVQIRTPAGGKPKHLMYYSLDLYFKNGGGPCYIISVGNYNAGAISSTVLGNGLTALEKEDEPTIIVMPDAANLTSKDEYYTLCNDVLTQCHKLGDRFGIFDVLKRDTDAANFRQGIRSETEYLKYGATYTPYLQTSIAQQYNEEEVMVHNFSAIYTLAEDSFQVIYAGNISNIKPEISVLVAQPDLTKTTKAKSKKRAGSRASETVKFQLTGQLLNITLPSAGATTDEILSAWEAWKATHDAMGFNLVKLGDATVNKTLEPTLFSYDPTPLSELKSEHTGYYNAVLAALEKEKVVLPPSSAMAGIYAATDRERGVWKSPANVGIASVTAPVEDITGEEQENLNVDSTAGKSVNAIRSFTGKGILVWGARTLAGNDNEWRYIATRRLFNTIEESCKKSTRFAVFEPNDANTWLKVKAMTDSYLYGLWQQGALAGAVPEDAYFVNVGIGKSMTPQDVLEGRMIVEIGIAAVRPAEFILLRFSHQMQES